MLVWSQSSYRDAILCGFAASLSGQHITDSLLRKFEDSWEDVCWLSVVSDERQEHPPVHAPAHDAHPRLPAARDHAHPADRLQSGSDRRQGDVPALTRPRAPPLPLPVHAGRREIPEPTLLHSQRRALQVSVLKLRV